MFFSGQPSADTNEKMPSSPEPIDPGQPENSESIPDSQGSDSGQGLSQEEKASSQTMVKLIGSAPGISASKKRKQRNARGKPPTANAAPPPRRTPRNEGNPSQLQPTKVKKVKAKSRTSKPTVLLRCGLCMDWFESEETEAGAWVCQTCRLMPANINTLLEEVRSLRTLVSDSQKTMKDLVHHMAAKVAECDTLRQENSSLRERTEHTILSATVPHTSLLIVDSIIRDIDADKLVDTTVISIGGACVDVVKRRCLQSKERFAKISMVVGTNDCASQDDAESILTDYKLLLQAAKEKAVTVTVSSVCPVKCPVMAVKLNVVLTWSTPSLLSFVLIQDVTLPTTTTTLKRQMVV